MDTIAIPGLADNLIYMVVDGEVAAVVDPGEAGPVLKALRSSGTRLLAIVLTHFHGDHTGGVAELRKATGCAVVGPGECSGTGLDRVVEGGDRVSVGSLDFGVLHTPGHTAGHVCYHLATGISVWTGDTLFVGGCGRILEGTAGTMWRSLCALRALPPETAVHPGHDYTLDNLEFAAEILPGDPAIERMRIRMLDLVESGKPAAPSSIAFEREANIFLRSDTDAVRLALDMRGADPLSVFAALRSRKDKW